MNTVEKLFNSRIFKNIYLFYVILILISLYPLRWSFTGADLWDTGYNCGNFIHFDRNVLGDTWFFSTFLSGAAGHLLSMLPGGHTLAGLRMMSGFIISANVLVSSLFCVRSLNLSRGPVLFGSLLAVSLCYNPSVVLYNHLSFFILNLTIILVYKGLTRKKNYLLFAGGFLLAADVFVRFSNITQAALFIGVVYYLILCGKKGRECISVIMSCICGYIAALALMFIVISRYGISDYIAGVRGLFTMTEQATEYKPLSMIMRMFDSYIRGGRRIADILIFSGLAVLLSAIWLRIKKGRQADRVSYVTSVIAGTGLIVFFVNRQLMQFDFHHYITVILTAAMFVDIALLLFFRVIIIKKRTSEDKLMAALLILYVPIQSVGSNTAISPIMNSMFIFAPVMISELIKLIKETAVQTCTGNRGTYIKTVIQVTSIALTAFYMQCILFGAGYCYQEAGNGAGGGSYVSGNRILKGIKMSEERADVLQGLTDYINDTDNAGHNAVIYGYAPSLAFYMDLNPVMSTWPDLDSYSLSVMEDRIGAIKQKPLIILNKEGLSRQREHDQDKWEILASFMNENGYVTDYDDGRIEVLVCPE